MSEREDLADVIGSVSPTGHVYSKGNDACPAAADAVLASPWLRAHDDRIRADALAPVHALADDLDPVLLGYWGGVLSAAAHNELARIEAALRAAAGTPTHHTTEEEAP